MDPHGLACWFLNGCVCVCVDSPVVATSLPMEMLPKESYRKAHELVDYVNKEISNLMTLYHYLHVQKIDL